GNAATCADRKPFTCCQSVLRSAAVAGEASARSARSCRDGTILHRLLEWGFGWSVLMSMADRDGHIWYDGRLVPWRNATTHVLTHSLHYGLAVFEGVRAYNTVRGTAI